MGKHYETFWKGKEGDGKKYVSKQKVIYETLRRRGVEEIGRKCIEVRGGILR